MLPMLSMLAPTGGKMTSLDHEITKSITEYLGDITYHLGKNAVCTFSNASPIFSNEIESLSRIG